MRAKTVLAFLVASLAIPLAGASAAGTGLYGVVRKGPTKPVCVAGEPCDGPAKLTLVFSRRTQAGAPARYTARSNASGAYRVSLPAGYYQVTTQQRVGVGRGVTPRTVDVRAGRWQKINFFIDTGIR